jgi:hypothetical protein
LFQDYEVDLYLRQKWQDERLKHSEITEALDLNDPNLVKAIWKPEVYFPNAKHAEFQYVTVPNVLVRINPDGEILYMLRRVLSRHCCAICCTALSHFETKYTHIPLELKKKISGNEYR